MCGLCGFITHNKANLTAEQVKTRNQIFTVLLMAMQSRGTDSAGLVGITDDKWKLYKKAIEAFEFVKEEKYWETLNEKNNIVIGHTRQKTTGIVSDRNAHPFQRGNIVGAHNGMVSNYLEIDNKVDVDSEVIFSLLNKNKNNFTETFKKLSGSFAITWVDVSGANSVYLVAQDNPLALVNIKELKTYFWCSTKEDLAIVLQASVGLGKRDIWSPKQNTVYQINTDFKITKHKVEFKEDNVFTGGGQSSSNYGKGYWEDDDLAYGKYGQANGELETMEFVTENSGCELCQQSIKFRKEDFYWNEAEETCLCFRCGLTERIMYEYDLITKNKIKEIEELEKMQREEEEKEAEADRLLEKYPQYAGKKKKKKNKWKKQTTIPFNRQLMSIN